MNLKICNMDDTGCFFKTLPEKGLAKIRIKQEGVKNLKLDRLFLSLLMLQERKSLNHWSNAEVLNLVASKTLKIYTTSIQYK